MAKRMDEQILALAEKPYWKEVQFKEGELRKFAHNYNPSPGGRHLGAREFAIGDVVIILRDDDGDQSGVECMTRHGYMKVRRTVLTQYTEKEEAIAETVVKSPEVL